MKGIDGHSPFGSAHLGAPHLSIADAVVMGQIGKSLAKVYQDVLHEPLPERLALLLRRVDETLRTRG
jgi:hypothetical protein